MTRFVPALITLLALTSCTLPTNQAQMKGPQAVGVSPHAPRDPVGIMLGWTPDQTITNFKHLDQLFPVRTVPRGASMVELPDDEPIDPIVPLEGRRLTVDQLMVEFRVTGVIALHHGRIVFERYAHGRTAQDRWFSASAAKSVTSTLIGAAIRDGLIGSVDDPITRYIPELKVAPAFDGVTLRHLMSMSSGLRFHESTTDPTSDLALTDGGEIIDGRPPIVTYAMKLMRDEIGSTSKRTTRARLKPANSRISSCWINRISKSATKSSSACTRCSQSWPRSAHAGSGRRAGAVVAAPHRPANRPSYGCHGASKTATFSWAPHPVVATRLSANRLLLHSAQ